MADSIEQLLADVRAFLSYQGSLGLSGLPLAQDVLTVRQTAPVQVLAQEPVRALAAPPVRAADVGAGQAAPGAPDSLEHIRRDIGDCRRCKLCRGRTHIVFGVGNPRAELMFVGEAPGRDEDLQGEPFVGEAGKLLDRMIRAMGLSRAQVYIANIIKCRPPRNRDPEPDEVAACEPFLRRQIAAVDPKLIIALGRVAAQTLLRERTPIGRLRGHWRTYENRPLMPTFHPAYLLRNPADKKLVWHDLQLVMGTLGLPTGP